MNLINNKAREKEKEREIAAFFSLLTSNPIKREFNE